MALQGKRILLVISGGIAAFKSLDLIRRLREHGASVRCVLTAGGERFVTPLSVSALSEDRVYRDIFSLTDEAEMGHIRLSRDADLILVAPATADILARMAGGLANDLATTVLLATDKPVMAAPAMNVRMWEHAATKANMAALAARGVALIGPVEGEMACGEYGFGRMSEVPDIVAALAGHFGAARLAGRTALVTSGPTHEAIDPVRYIANRSSGKQGHAIAAALAAAGAQTMLVSGPTALCDPAGVTTMRVESAREMLAACKQAMPADIVVCAAAVSDWRVRAVADQEGWRRPAGAGIHREPGYPEDPGGGGVRAAGGRVCRRDATYRRECAQEAPCQELRLDAGERCFARHGHVWRRRQYDPSDRRGQRGILAGHDQTTGRRTACRADRGIFRR